MEIARGISFIFFQFPFLPFSTVEDDEAPGTQSMWTRRRQKRRTSPTCKMRNSGPGALDFVFSCAIAYKLHAPNRIL